MAYGLNWTVLSVLTGHMNHKSSLPALAGEVNPELGLLCGYSQMTSTFISIAGSYSQGISFKFVFIQTFLTVNWAKGKK